MIIQRLSKGIKEQDWFVVMVEIMIVVVGIFIGLQVDDWNQERKNKVLEGEYLERLLVEADRSILEQKERVQYGENKLAAIKRAHTLMYKGEVTEENRVQFSKDFDHIYAWPGLRIYLDTIDELVDGGRLPLIRSLEIRGQITSLRNRVAGYRLSQSHLSDILKQTYFSINKIIARDEEGTIITLPLKDLNGDTPLYRLLRGAMGNQEAYMRYNYGALELVEEFRQTLANSLERL